MAREPKVEIHNGNVKMEFERKNILEIKNAPDGIVINMRENMYLTITDQHMPYETKAMIASAFNSFSKADLVINFKNYRIPTLVKPIPKE